jgi:hypothetical protein
MTGERWEVVPTKAWGDERAAYRMEQALLDRLRGRGIRLWGEYFQAPARAGLVEVTLWTEAMVDAQQALCAGGEARSQPGASTAFSAPAGP